MKKSLPILAALLALTLPAAAQVAGNYTFGISNAVSANTTNLSAVATTPARADVLRCDEFCYAGLSVSFKPGTAVTGNLTLRFAVSMDGLNFCKAPALTFAAPLNNTTLTTASGGSLDLHGVTHIQLYAVENTNGVDVASLYVTMFLKSPKFGARPATR